MVWATSLSHGEDRVGAVARTIGLVSAMLSRAPETREPVSEGGGGCDHRRLCRVDRVISCFFIHQRKQLESPVKETDTRRHGAVSPLPPVFTSRLWPEHLDREQPFLTRRWDVSCLSESLSGTCALRSQDAIGNCTNQTRFEFPERKDTEPLIFLMTWHLRGGAGGLLRETTSSRGARPHNAPNSCSRGSPGEVRMLWSLGLKKKQLMSFP